MTTEFACNPSNVDGLPWRPDCQQCTNLHNAGESGLFTWVMAVGRHFEDQHQIVLEHKHQIRRRHDGRQD